MATKKSRNKKISDAMKKRWAARKNPPPIQTTNETQTPPDLAEARVNNLRSMWESSLDALVGERDRLSAQLKGLEKHIRIRMIQLELN